MARRDVEQLLLRHEPMVRAFFGRRVRREEDVEDLVQDTMCAILDALPRYRGEASLATWIYAICSRQLGTFYRGRDRRSRLFVALMREARDGAASDEEVRIRTLALEECRERLPREQRKLFVDRYQSRLSISEIASLFGCAEGTVKYRLYLLRNELRKLLG